MIDYIYKYLCDLGVCMVSDACSYNSLLFVPPLLKVPGAVGFPSLSFSWFSQSIFNDLPNPHTHYKGVKSGMIKFYTKPDQLDCTHCLFILHYRFRKESFVFNCLFITNKLGSFPFPEAIQTIQLSWCEAMPDGNVLANFNKDHA